MIWKAQVENEVGRKVIYLRIDNITEYMDRQFINFYKSEGKIRYFTTLGTPQQNGVA